MMDVRTVLTCPWGAGRLRVWAWLWMISVLLQAAPARAQERQPDSEAQPPPTAEDSPPPSPASQGEAPSPPAAPEAPAAEEKDPASPLGGLEELLQEDVPTASVGSFGYRLRRYGIAPYVHGALAVDLWRVRQQEEGEPYYQGFDLRDAHLYFGADILDLIVPELFVEFEADEPGQSALFLRYAQIDVRLHEQLFVMRAGLFLIPFGIFNTESFPRFIAKLPDRAKFYDEVTPVPWREVGIQFLGRWEWRPGLSLSYAVSLTNGMEQPDIDDPADPTDDGVDEGGSLGNLQNVFEEVNNSKKSLGGRVRLEFLPGLAVGLSGYTGAYTTHGARRLSSVGLDVSFSRGNLSLELETALARQEVTGGALTKWGYVAIAAYRLHPMVEPVLAVDEVRLDGDPEEDERTYWAGLNVFPFPDQIPTALFKAAYSGSIHGDHFVHHQLSVQFVVGF